MKTKTLIETNPYLQDAKIRENLIKRSVRTSCGVEGIKTRTNNQVHFDIPERGGKKIYKTTQD